MNYTEEELCTLVDQLPDIQYNLQMPVTSINLLGLTPDLFYEEVYEILKDYLLSRNTMSLQHSYIMIHHLIWPVMQM